MFILEPYLYDRARKTFDDSGLVREMLPWTSWERMIEIQKTDGIDCFVISHEPYPDEFYRKLKKGSLIIRFGVGYDAVPVALCRELGILVANTPGTLDQSVAEHAMSLITTAARQIVKMDSDLKAGKWAPVMAEELQGQTLAIIGFGSIGRTLAKIAKFGFGMRITAFDVYEGIRTSHPDLFDKFTSSFEDAVRDADYVSLHMNLNPTSAGFINTERLGYFKRGAVLVNTARGGVIREEDLFTALKAGRLSAAALDVFQKEPYVPAPGHDLRTLPNVLLTPHIASHTTAANRRMAQSCVESAKKYAAGRISEIPIIPELR